jgi:hypothetical protein
LNLKLLTKNVLEKALLSPYKFTRNSSSFNSLPLLTGSESKKSVTDCVAEQKERCEFPFETGLMGGWES